METDYDERLKIVRNTFEYHEACELVLEKEALRAKIMRIESELKKVRRLSYLAVTLAKNDALYAAKHSSGESLDHSTKAEVGSPLDNPPSRIPEKLSAEQQAGSLARFLAAMDRKVAWEKLDAIVAPAYSKGAWPAPHFSVSSMVRLYFLQHWCCMSHEALAQRIHDWPAINTFVGIDRKMLPRPAILLRFKSMLEQSGLAAEIAQAVIDGLGSETRPRPLVLRSNGLQIEIA